MPAFAFRTLLCFVALGLAVPASAEEFCATNSEELAFSLFYAATNGQDDVIRVHIGTYGGTSPYVFRYIPASLTDGDTGKSLTLVGGYTEFSGYPCGQILVEDPILTILNGGGTDRALELHVYNNSDVTIRLLTFFNGNPENESVDQGGGLYYHMGGSDGGYVTIERNIFRSNEARYGAGLSISGARGPVRVINNLFTTNHADLCASGGIYTRDSTGGVSGAYVANNTVISNTVTNPESNDKGAGLCLTSRDVITYVHNNNFWNNDRNDLSVHTNDFGFALHNNNFEALYGDAPTESSGNISVQPRFESGFLNFTPVRSSPLVDAGAPPAPPTLWYLTDYDLRAQTRVVGSRVDIGAYENERIFADGFEGLGGIGPALTAEPPCESLACDGAY